MRWDQKQKFKSTFIQNVDGTVSLSLIAGSSSGVTPKSLKHSDVMAFFTRTIVNGSIRKA